MIMTTEELMSYMDTTVKGPVLEAKLQALEILIRKHTNNNFQDRRYRSTGHVSGNVLRCANSALFRPGDTIMVDEDLVTITDITGDSMTISESLLPEDQCLVTKVVYPMDVKMGVVNMLKWDLENREKVGVQSETISRHSVTYFDMGADNSSLGYPKSLTGFMKPYMKARF